MPVFDLSVLLKVQPEALLSRHGFGRELYEHEVFQKAVLASYLLEINTKSCVVSGERSIPVVH